MSCEFKTKSPRTINSRNCIYVMIIQILHNIAVSALSGSNLPVRDLKQTHAPSLVCSPIEVNTPAIPRLFPLVFLEGYSVLCVFPWTLP